MVRSPRSSSTRTPFAAALFTTLAVVLSACASSTPPPLGAPVAAARPVVHTVEGTDLDLLYVSGGSRGCAPDADHQACGGSQTLDLFRSTGDRGTIVFIHGGGFAGGDKSQREELGPLIRQIRNGWDIVSINYRLASPLTRTNMFPTAMQDVAAALDWVRGSAGRARGLDAGRVVVAGHSAGGTLAALAGTAWNSGRAEFAGLPRVDGYVGVSAVYDFDYSPFWGLFWLTDPATQKHLASPVTWLDRNDPPGHLVHGDQDTAVEVGGTLFMANAAAEGGFSNRLSLDIVDFHPDGRPMPASTRGHAPSAGLDNAALDAFLSRI